MKSQKGLPEKFSRNSSGFAILEGLLILVIVGILGGTGWYVWQAKAQTDKTYDTTTNAQARPSSPGGWKDYTNEVAGLKFSYPSNWISSVDDAINDNGIFGGINGKLTSPSGNKLVWTYYYAGGKGGSCEPAENDKPFADGNNCSTQEKLSVVKIKSVQPPKNFKDRSLFMDNLYITHTKYKSQGSSKISYQICLDAYNSSDSQPKVGAQMELLFPCDHWTTGFNVQFDVASEADFNSSDALTAESIMKSFDSIH